MIRMNYLRYVKAQIKEMQLKEAEKNGAIAEKDMSIFDTSQFQ